MKWLTNLINRLKGQAPLPMSAVEKGLSYTPQDPGKNEMRDIEKAFTRTFATDDGQKVLAHLQVTTFQRALGQASAMRI